MLRLRSTPRKELSPRRRVVRRVALGLVAVVVVYAAVVVQAALFAGGNDTFAARLAESGRDHGLGPLVTALEEVQYRFAPPRSGGVLDPSAAGALPTAPAPQPSSSQPSEQVLTLPPVPAVAHPALPGEGVFTPRVWAGGRPVVETALLRPDSTHTSYLAGVAWMSGAAVRFVQHPGSSDPGRLTSWTQPPTVPASQRTGLVATFNSGFKTSDSRGAYYADGVTVGHFRDGAASLVIYRDGHVDVAAWGRDATLSSDVVSVRQNLDLLVDGGQVSPAVDSRARADWGATVGSAAYVWRSGVGVTATGDVVYVAGDALSAHTLAVLLQNAGAVRAMELDINRDWVSYMWYSGPAAPHKLVDFMRPADRYFSVNSRDFFAVYLR